MAINYPSSPQVNDTYSYGGRTWKYNGVAWDAITTTFGPTGPTGPTGLTGPTGPEVTGPTGPTGLIDIGYASLILR